MKTTMNISVEKDVKIQFTKYANKIGTNPTNLLNMLMVNTINTGEVRFWVNPISDFEVEHFSEEEMNDLLSSESIQKNQKKLRSILSKKKEC